MRVDKKKNDESRERKKETMRVEKERKKETMRVEKERKKR